MFNPTHRFSLETQRGPSGEVTTQWDRSFPRGIHHVSIWGETVYVGTESDIVAIETSGTERWRFSTNTPHGGNHSSPAVVDGTVYVGSDNNYVYALDAETGDCDWRFQTNRWVRSSPAVVDGTVYVGGTDGYVYALSASRGTEQWKFNADAPLNSSPAVVNDIVYIGSNDNNMYALDAQTGALKWDFKTDGNIESSSPTVIDGTVYIGSHDKHVYALDATTGSVKWRYQTGGHVSTSPAVVDGTVYLGSDDNYMYALDAETGNCDWRFQTEGRVNTSPMIASDEVYVGTSMFKNPVNNLSNPESFLYSIDADTGNGNWRFKMNGSVVSPVVADGVIFVSSVNYTTDEYKLYALEGKEVSMNNIETHGKEDCLACGSDLTIYDNVNFCPECGTEVSNNDNSDTRIYDPK